MCDRTLSPEVGTAVQGQTLKAGPTASAARQRWGAGGLAVVLLCAAATDAALAQGKGRGQAAQPAASSATVAVVVTHGFGTRDREIITTYYTSGVSGLPPGLAKREGGLPPGLEKQLRRNGTLPPGVQKNIQPFPAALERQLARLPDGYRRGIVDGHGVVYRTGTYKIVDVILNALAR